MFVLHVLQLLSDLVQVILQLSVLLDFHLQTITNLSIDRDVLGREEEEEEALL